MKTAVKKRPLCMICIVLILLILLARRMDLPIFGEPPDDPVLAACTEQERTVQIIGRVSDRRMKTRSVQYVLTNSYLRSENTQIPLYKILMTADEETELSAGSLVLVSGIISVPEPASNPGQFDLQSYYASQNIYYTVSASACTVLEQGGGVREMLLTVRNHLSSSLDSVADQDSAEVLKAILLGDRSGLTADSRRSWQVGGVLHLLAISGLHISLVGQGLLKLLRKAGLPMAPAAAAVFLVLAGYCLMTGASPSSLRAVCMFAVYLGSKLLLRTYDSLCALALTGILMLLENPAVLFFIGFQMSFCAVLAVSLCWPALSWLLPGQIKKPAAVRTRPGPAEEVTPQRLEKTWISWFHYYRRRLLHQAAFWLVMTAAMLPLTSWYYYEISIWGMLPNLLLIPAAPVLLASGIFGTLAGSICRPAGRIAILPACWILQKISWLAERIRELPAATLVCGKPEIWQTALSAAILCILTGILLKERAAAGKQAEKKRKIRKDRCRKLAGAGLFLFLSVLLVRRIPLWSLTALDVGQGDCLVLRDRSACFMVDGGSSSVSSVGNYRILPYLRSQGISRLDGIIVTHPDEDHINGILEILTAVKEKQATLKVDVLYLPVWMEESEEEEELKKAASAAGARICYLAKGDSIHTENMELTVLYPLYEGGIRSGNSGSVVLSMSCGNFDALLTGDLESNAESFLLPLDRTYEYLKVGHHGSRGASSAEFLSQVQPSAAVISAPEDSIYGHPHQETLDRLTAAGAQAYVTRDCGAVIVEGSENTWTLRGYLLTQKSEG